MVMSVTLKYFRTRENDRNLPAIKQGGLLFVQKSGGSLNCKSWIITTFLILQMQRSFLAVFKQQFVIIL